MPVLIDRGCKSSIVQLQVLIWSILGTVLFVSSWCVTGGGYFCSLPVFAACSLYCCSSGWCSSGCCLTGLRSSMIGSCLACLKNNCRSVVERDKRMLMLVAGYCGTKSYLMWFHPAVEKSNGSPLSLILFTVFYILIYVIPPLLEVIFSHLKALCKGQSVMTNWRKIARLILKAVSSWKRSLLAIFSIVLVTYLLDGQITSSIRFLGAGKLCWPLLLSQNSAPPANNLPPSIHHSILWHLQWKNYQPHWLIKSLISYGRELGEVCHLLPVLIGTFVFSRILFPQAYSHVNRALFACIGGVVLGGVICGSFKILFHRYRPNAYGNPYMWTGPGMTTVNHLAFSKLDLSFPAGHTTVTTAVATCLYMSVTMNLAGVKVSRWTSLLLLLCLYVHPVLVLLSRVSDCYHWTSDASFGVSLVKHVLEAKSVQCTVVS